ncbi:MAG: dihydrolipoamide acetyltransferase family protein [Flavobacteriaceae bacterium]
MAKFELKLPKMGESVAEATITNWLKNVGDVIEMDEPVLEIATDKVDSEVPSEVNGVLKEILFHVDDVVNVGETLAIIETDSEYDNDEEIPESYSNEVNENDSQVEEITEKLFESANTNSSESSQDTSSARFYSPLVKNIAKTEGISSQELETIQGTGSDGRVTKNDILNYLDQKSSTPSKNLSPKEPIKSIVAQDSVEVFKGEDEIIEMTRMGKLVSQHMLSSIQTSAHVQSFIEADVTKIWNWRKQVKEDFFRREGENLTFTPIFMEAVAKALRDYPMMNISVKGDKIIKKKNINIGMAAALPDGNLIVPVIKNADQLNLVGMTKIVNDLANRSRSNQLKPDEIQEGTYTVTNVGSFGSIMGTPIINQPQVGILALGAIRKVPAVIETSEGDFIGIRYKMFLSHSYDHRVVNGALGGMFVKAVKEYLEAWDINRDI